MEIITKSFAVYDFEELSETAKEVVRDWYNDNEMHNEMFYEDVLCVLSENFPNSNLKVEYSLNCCQGDGLNIYGTLSFTDIIDKLDFSDKEKRALKFYAKYGKDYICFEQNRRYTYSMKNINRKCNIQDEIDELVEMLTYNQIRNINVNLIENFYNAVFDYFYKMDREFEKQGYECLYNHTDDEIVECCEANEYKFLADGTLFN